MTSIEKIITSISDLVESIWNILSYPNQARDELAASILDLIHEYNLDPVYITTVFMNLLVLSYWGNFKNWDIQIPFIKHSAIIAAAFAGFLNLWSLLKLLGIIDG